MKHGQKNIKLLRYIFRKKAVKVASNGNSLKNPITRFHISGIRLRVSWQEKSRLFTLSSLVTGTLIYDLSPEDHEIKTSQNPATRSHLLW